MHFCTRFSEQLVVFCVDGVDGEWELCRISCAIMGVTSLGAGLVIYGKGELLCPPSLEWGIGI